MQSRAYCWLCCAVIASLIQASAFAQERVEWGKKMLQSTSVDFGVIGSGSSAIHAIKVVVELELP